MNVWEWVVFQHWQDKEKAGSAGVITVTVMSAVRLPLHDPPLLLSRSNLFIMHQLTPFASHWHSQVPKKGWPKGEQERERERERIEINKESTASRNLPACFPIRGFSLFLSAFPLSSFRLSPYPRLRVPFSDNQSSVIDFALYQLRRKALITASLCPLYVNTTVTWAHRERLSCVLKKLFNESPPPR